MPDAEHRTYFNIHGVPYRGELVETDHGRRRVRIYPKLVENSGLLVL